MGINPSLLSLFLGHAHSTQRIFFIVGYTMQSVKTNFSSLVRYGRQPALKHKQFYGMGRRFMGMMAVTGSHLYTDPLPPPPHPSLGNINLNQFKLNKIKAAATHPPGHPAELGELATFVLPETVTGSAEDVRLGQELVKTWRRDGILQIAFPKGLEVLNRAIQESKRFFALDYAEKAKWADDQNFAGYIASGEELTDGIADYSEIFTVLKDLPESDYRVKEKWVFALPLVMLAALLLT